MKRLFFVFCAVAGGTSVAEADEGKPEVEITLMAIGDPAGGKLRAGRTGCAIVHFRSRTEGKIDFPTAPRRLGKGRVEDWDDASYLSPKQGEDYGWGYRAAVDAPVVKLEFIGVDGKVAHTDESIQLQAVGVLEVWASSPMLFSTPREPGTYAVRFHFDNTSTVRESGHNIVSPRTERLVTVKERLEIPGVVVIGGGAERPDAEEGEAEPGK